MIKRLTCLVGLIAVTGLLLPAQALPLAAEEPICIADRAKADVLVHREDLMPPRSLEQVAGRLDKGRVLSTLLCTESGRYVYQVVLRGGDGRIRRETVDARKPFER